MKKLYLLTVLALFGNFSYAETALEQCEKLHKSRLIPEAEACYSKVIALAPTSVEGTKAKCKNALWPKTCELRIKATAAFEVRVKQVNAECKRLNHNGVEPALATQIGACSAALLKRDTLYST